MKRKLTLTVLIIAVLIIGVYMIYPTFSWHFLMSERLREISLMSEEQKEALDKSPEELAEAKSRFIQKINELKELIAINRDERNKKYHLLTVNDSDEVVPVLTVNDLDEVVPARFHRDKNIVFNIIPISNKVNKFLLNTSKPVTKAIFGNNSYKIKEFIKITRQAIKIRDEINAALEFRRLRNSIYMFDTGSRTRFTVSVDKHDLIKKMKKKYEQKGLIDKNPVDAIVKAESIPDKSKIRFDDVLLTAEIKKDNNDITDGDLIKELEKRKNYLLSDDLNGYLDKVKDELTKAHDNGINVIKRRIDLLGIPGVRNKKRIRQPVVGRLLSCLWSIKQELESL